jgi:hypothetical protein
MMNKILFIFFTVWSTYFNAQDKNMSLEKPQKDNLRLDINFQYLNCEIDSVNLSILRELDNVLNDFKLNNIKLVITPYLCENETSIDKYIALKRAHNIISYLSDLRGDKIVFYNIIYNDWNKFDNCNKYGVGISISHR